MPIIRASEYKHKWIKKAVADMKTNGSLAKNIDENMKCRTQRQRGNKEFMKIRHTAKCPFLNVAKYRFIIRLHQDIKNKTIGKVKI